MAPAAFDALSSIASTGVNNNNNNSSTPDLLFTTDSRSFSHLVATLKITAEQEQWLLDVILKRTVTMYRANATDEKKIVNKSAAILSKLDVSQSGDGVVVSQSIQACKAVQQNVAESSSDHLALEIFLRDTTYRNLHSAAKSRESRLKERIKAVHGLLSKLEQAEKAFIRALTDLKDEERKHSYLMGRKELDISEEIEKVEIDLRKCASQLAVKLGEYDIVKSRLLDIQKSWRDEWHGFRIYTRNLELERKADIRNVLLDLSRASLLIKQAEIARQTSLIAQLEDQDLFLDLSNVHHFATASLGQMDASLPTAMKVDTIRAKIWPGGAPPAAVALSNSIPSDPFTPSSNRVAGRANKTGTVSASRNPPLNAEQLASISRPGRPPALNILQRDAATYASYMSSSANINNSKSEARQAVSAPAVFNTSSIPLTASLSASSSASSGSTTSSTSAASTPRSADFPVPPGSGRKSFDSPVILNSAKVGNREYGEEMFSIPRKAVPKDTVVLDKWGRPTTTPSRNIAETPTKPSTYRSPHRSPLDVLLFSSALGNNNGSNSSSVYNRTSPAKTDANDSSATPTAIKASLLSNANTTPLVGNDNCEGSARKASKPLPGLPPGKIAEETDEKNGVNGAREDDVEGGDVVPPSLPSFSNLKLSEMRMSGMWFAQT